MTTHFVVLELFCKEQELCCGNLSPQNSLISNPVYNKKEYQDLICSFTTVPSFQIFGFALFPKMPC
jgi:hypothetical protein